MEKEIIVQQAIYMGGYQILLKFSNDTFRIIDLSSWQEKDMKTFSDIRKEKYFKKFKIKFGSLVWPNGYDISPEYLYVHSKPAIIKAAS